LADSRICTIPGCGKPVRSRGLCSTDYWREWKVGRFSSEWRAPPRWLEKAAFLQLAASSQTDDCILWPWGTDTAGYGSFVHPNGGKADRAHRAVCTIVHGIPSLGANLACHSCDTPRCCNPRHLRWGSSKMNVADAYERGRANFGERSYHAKLTEDDVREIRTTKEDSSSLAVRFGVSVTAIRDIRNGRRWKRSARLP
jgi:hypothetical protein